MKEDFTITFRAGDFVYILYRSDFDDFKAGKKHETEFRLTNWDTDMQEAIDLLDKINASGELWIPASEMPAWAERPEVTP